VFDVFMVMVYKLRLFQVILHSVRKYCLTSGCPLPLTRNNTCYHKQEEKGCTIVFVNTLLFQNTFLQSALAHKCRSNHQGLVDYLESKLIVNVAAVQKFNHLFINNWQCVLLILVSATCHKEPSSQGIACSTQRRSVTPSSSAGTPCPA